MVRVVFDPSLLAFTPAKTVESFRSQVEFLTRWARILRDGQASIHVTPELKNFLIRNNFFPAHTAVHALLTELGLHYQYNAQDLINPITTILNLASTTIYCCAKDEVHEQFESTPPQPWNADESVNNESQRALILAMIERELHSSPALLFATQLPCKEVEFNASLLIIEPDDLSGFEPQALPKNIAGQALSVYDEESVFDFINPQQVWADATDATSIKLAIRLQCRQRMKQSNLYKGMSSIPKFLVGADFLASLPSCQAANRDRFASATLDACASAVLRLPTFEWHDFHKNNRKADNAAPLRGHISKGGSALRLMAWEKPAEKGDTIIEFANVGEKWDEEIEYSDPTLAV